MGYILDFVPKEETHKTHKQHGIPLQNAHSKADIVMYMWLWLCDFSEYFR